MRARMNKKEGTGFGVQNRGCSRVCAETVLTRIPKICIHEYECWHCAFSQWLEEMEKSQSSTEAFNDARDFLAQAA